MNFAITPIRYPQEIQQFGLPIIIGAFIIMAISAIAASIGFSKISRSCLLFFLYILEEFLQGFSI